MTDLIPVPEMSQVPQLETTTLALGGTGNPMNAQAQALLNRTAFLDGAVSSLATEVSGLTGASSAFFDLYGYEDLGAYVGGLTFDQRTDYVKVDGLNYRPLSSVSLPYLASGDWDADKDDFFAFGTEDVFRQSISAPSGSSEVGFIADGTDLVPRTVQEKLRDTVSRAEYSSDAAFNAAKGLKPSIDGSSSFDAKVRPAGEPSQIDLSAALRPAIGQGRSRLNYFSGQVIEAYIPETLIMGGFRFAGSYKKGRAPVFPSGVNGKTTASLVGNLGVETSVHAHNWYALFACANPGDASVSYKLMPFLRVASVSGSVASLTYAGEGASAHVVTPATYAWPANSLQSVDCLVINEGSSNRFSGRVTTITANAAGSISLNDPGSVGPFDFLLPAPPLFAFYAYLGSFYRDSSEIRNIADDGSFVGTYGVQVQDPNVPSSGAIASPGLKMNFGGYISPLAISVKFEDSETITSASTGQLAINISHDGSNHVVGRQLLTKETAITPYTQAQVIDIPFSVGQYAYIYTAGSRQDDRTNGRFQIYGYSER